MVYYILPRGVKNKRLLARGTRFEEESDQDVSHYYHMQFVEPLLAPQAVVLLEMIHYTESFHYMLKAQLVFLFGSIELTGFSSQLDGLRNGRGGIHES